MAQTPPSHYYGNPLNILIAEESRTCAGCAHKEMYFGIQFCGKNPEKSGQKMKKCKSYKELT